MLDSIHCWNIIETVHVCNLTRLDFIFEWCIQYSTHGMFIFNLGWVGGDYNKTLDPLPHPNIDYNWNHSYSLIEWVDGDGGSKPKL